MIGGGDFDPAADEACLLQSSVLARGVLPGGATRSNWSMLTCLLSGRLFHLMRSDGRCFWARAMP
ncbi:MAG: hypothetical protein CBARDCOR_0250 [uncultured Caballeronia sp.]|nr:MAG: hypothetical protein CBARDCOR_0250 [uncultured Caballeronia sp.]